MKRVYVHPTAVTDKTTCMRTVTKPVFGRKKACKRVRIFSVRIPTEEDITYIPVFWRR